MPGPTPYTCTSCRAALDDADDTASQGFVKCRFCGEVNRVEAASSTPRRVPQRPPAPQLGGPRCSARVAVRITARPRRSPCPKGFTVDCDATTLTIVRRWRAVA
jgi:hypothetical protein